MSNPFSRSESFPGDGAGGGEEIAAGSVLTTAENAMLCSVPCIQSLDPARLRELSPRIKQKSFRRGEVVVRQGDPAQMLLVVSRGKIKLDHTTSTGRQKTVRILGDGECYCVGPANGAVPSPVTAECLTKSELMVLGPAEMDKLDQEEGFREEVIRCMAQRYAVAIAGQASAALDSVQEKVAALLVDLAERVGRTAGEGIIISDVTQESLAQCVGCAREVASRTLLQMQSEGLIRTARGKIQVLELESLRRLSTQRHV